MKEQNQAIEPSSSAAIGHNDVQIANNNSIGLYLRAIMRVVAKNFELIFTAIGVLLLVILTVGAATNSLTLILIAATPVVILALVGIIFGLYNIGCFIKKEFLEEVRNLNNGVK